MTSTDILADAASAASNASPPFISAHDAAAYLHKSLAAVRGSHYSGFILKNRDNHYFAAKALVARHRGAQSEPDQQTDDALAVTVDTTGALRAPAGYAIEAYFIAHSDRAKGRNELRSEWAMRQRFFCVSDLLLVMSIHRPVSTIYLSTNDGSLLCYASTRSEYEQELKRHLAKPVDGGSSRFERLYEDGELPAGILILLALAAGKLTTVVAGDLWRRRGRITGDWRARLLETNPRVELMPVFGPMLKDGKAIAHYLHGQLATSQPKQQHLGLVLKHKTQNVFIVTEPIDSVLRGFSRELLFPKDIHGNSILPADHKVHGVYHTRQVVAAERLPATQVELYKNFFSADDLREGVKRIVTSPGFRLYLHTPDGAVLRFANADAAKIATLKAKLDPPTDPDRTIESQIIAGTLKAQTLVDWLADAGELSVLRTSSTWSQSGRVSVTETSPP